MKAVGPAVQIPREQLRVFPGVGVPVTVGATVLVGAPGAGGATGGGAGGAGTDTPELVAESPEPCSLAAVTVHVSESPRSAATTRYVWPVAPEIGEPSRFH